MKQTKRLGVPLLVALLVALPLSVGAGGAAAEEPRATTGSIMIAAAAFNPTTDDWDYNNNGIWLTSATGGTFIAALSFPVPVVSIRRITLYAYDNGADSVCVSLLRASPPIGSETLAVSMCSAESVTDPQVVSTTAINPKAINTAAQSPYLWLTLGGDVRVYGVKITYSY